MLRESRSPLFNSQIPLVRPVVNAGTTADELPWLSFSMSPSGPPLYIPLAALLLDLYDQDGNRGLCVDRGEPAVVDKSADQVEFPPRKFETYGVYGYSLVSLGTMPLSALYFAGTNTIDRDMVSGRSNPGLVSALSHPPSTLQRQPTTTSSVWASQTR